MLKFSKKPECRLCQNHTIGFKNEVKNIKLSKLRTFNFSSTILNKIEFLALNKNHNIELFLNKKNAQNTSEKCKIYSNMQNFYKYVKLEKCNNLCSC